jgi:hypothetical protein
MRYEPRRLTWLQFRVVFEHIFNGESVFSGSFSRSVAAPCDNKGHDILGFDVFPLCHLLQGDLDRRHAVPIWILIWVLAKLLVSFVSENVEQITEMNIP